MEKSHRNTELWGKRIPDSTKKRIYPTIVEGTVTYNAEVWEFKENIDRAQERLLR